MKEPVVYNGITLPFTEHAETFGAKCWPDHKGTPPSYTRYTCQGCGWTYDWRWCGVFNLFNGLESFDSVMNRLVFHAERCFAVRNASGETARSEPRGKVKA